MVGWLTEMAAVPHFNFSQPGLSVLSVESKNLAWSAPLSFLGKDSCVSTSQLPDRFPRKLISAYASGS